MVRTSIPPLPTTLGEALADNRLTWGARGVLAGCYALTDGPITVDRLTADAGPEHVGRVINAFKELTTAGYLTPVGERHTYLTQSHRITALGSRRVTT